MSRPMIEVLALVDKSMEMKLPMTVKLHEVPVLHAVYPGKVHVLHYRDTDELMDGDSEIKRMNAVYGENPVSKQPWPETIFGAYGAGAATLDNFYEDDAAGVREDLLGDATPWPESQAAFDHPDTGAQIVPNVGDEGTAQDPRRIAKKPAGKALAKKPTGKRGAETAS